MNHHRHQKSLKVSLPARQSRPYLLYPPLLTPTPTPTPSSRRSFSQPAAATATTTPLFITTFLSTFSLYTLHPFLNSSPTLSVLPFSFLLTLSSSLILSLLFSSQHRPSLSLPVLRPLAVKGALLSLVLLLRFQSLHVAGPAATILADFSGSLAAKAVANGDRFRRVSGITSLLLALLVLAFGWDRTDCFSSSYINWYSDSFKCFGILRIVCPFASGYLGYLERSNWGSLKQLGKKGVRLYSLWFASAFLSPFAFVSWLQGNWGSDAVSFGGLIWPLFCSIFFGVILTELYGEERSGGAGSSPSQRISEREFLVLLCCTCVLELFYFSEFSLFGFVVVSFALWVAVNELGPELSKSPELGSGSSESLFSMVMGPIRHILSERKSRKIALFLLINTLYMFVEFIVGFMSNSLGLISDACHMLFDCAALAIGLYASYISRLPGNSQFNFGRGRFEVLSGYVNAVFLVLVGALIVVESFERILDPQEISTGSLLSVSIGGLVVNLVGLIFFHEEHHHAHGGAGACSHSHGHHSHSHEHEHGCSHKHDDHSNWRHDQSVTKSTCGSRNDPHDEKICNVASDVDHHHHHHDHDQEREFMCETRSSSHHHCHDNDHHCHDNHHHDHHRHDNHHIESSLYSGTQSHQQAHRNSSNLEDTCTEKSCSSQGKGHAHAHSHVHDNQSHVGVHNLKVSHGNPSENCIMVHPDAHSHCSLQHKHSHPGDLNSNLQKGSKMHNHIDHNMEGIFLHVLADTMGSLGVVISTLLIKYKGWLAADPACSIFISVMIVSSVIPLLRNSAEILLQRVPRFHEKEVKEAINDVMKLKGVCDIQNIHVWSLTNTEIVGTFHLHLSAESDKATKQQVANVLHHAGINDLTLQVEYVKGK
ncbi:uncharacterized protein LOC116259108 [Nymphaea colorata]|uniref:uncharacterized protein LOC116259108 n=1 Tax=Nymphaea colorata TaxID=210225 RepID=UPI00129E5530|nr:uncharacterized protein LOC116259108 [Nymphaea colorata]